MARDKDEVNNSGGTYYFLCVWNMGWLALCVKEDEAYPICEV